MSWLDHLIIAPILLPLVVSAIMLAYDDRHRTLKRILSLSTAAALIGISATLMWMAIGSEAAGIPPGPHVYLLGNWPAPFGIVLVVDRLSAMLLLLTSVIGFMALFYSLARWDRAGPRFHVLFLLLMMGVNGAFLTGDIFNLFVFFEVLLAASYGLILHGAGATRTSVSLHYITINIAASLLFLIGVAMLYAVTGTLNMANLASRITLVPESDLALLEAGAAILGIAFLVKAGIWPLCFWLPRTYGAAAPPVAALFAIMTKVGIYVILRLTSLLFGAEAGGAADFTDEALIYAGLATMAFGTLGILAAKQLTRVAGYYVLVSSGTLLAAIGFGGESVVAALLFYLVSSTLAVAAFFLVIEPVERNAGEDERLEGIVEPVFEDEYVGALSGNDDAPEDERGVVIPGTIAILGGGLIFCALLLSGLPPLSGFIAKFAMIDALFRPAHILPATWIFVGLIIFSGLASMIAMTRAGIDLLWTPADHDPPKLSLIEVVPIWLILSVCLGLMLGAGPIMRYMEATSASLHDPADYVYAVVRAPRAGGA